MLLLALLTGVLLYQPAAGQTPRAGDERIIQQSWTFRDGAPESVRTLAQTGDGYLWLGTPTGLFRFDGMRFELFRSPFGEQLSSTNVSALFASPSGGLWVGYLFGGVSFVHNGKVRNFTTPPSPVATVHCFAQDQNGVIWAATYDGLWRFDGSTWQQNPAGWDPQLKRVAQMGFDAGATLWVLTDNVSLEFGRQLFYLTREGKQFRKGGDDLQVQGFTRDSSSTILTSSETSRISHGSWQNSLPGYPVLRKNSEQIVDTGGGVWFLSPDPFILRSSRTGSLPEIVASASERSAQRYDINPYRGSALVDREGNFWIGDPTGVHRFSYTALSRVNIPVSRGPHFTIAPDEGGVVWVSAGNGNGSSSLYRVTARGAELHRAQGGVAMIAHRGWDKTLWFGGEGGLWHLADGRLTRVEPPPGTADKLGNLISLTQDSAGGIWVSFGPMGLFRLKDGVWTRNGGRTDLPAFGVIIASTDELGRVWFGYTKNRLAVIDGDRVRLFGPGDGVAVGNVLSFYGRGPDMWIGGEFGLQRFEGGRFQAIRSTDDASLRGISGIVQLANGDLWLNGLGGILHVPRAEVAKALNDPAHLVTCERLGRRHGLPGLPSQLARMPTAVEGTDGRLWFSVNNGVVWIDPAKASNKAEQVPVTVHSITADGRTWSMDSPVQLPPHPANIQIQFAAVSLTDPEAVRFRYKLLETDADWHTTGESNQVSYRNLGPGTYHFAVAASDTNGVWSSNNTATAEFRVLPAFYETGWFRGACVAIAVAMLWAGYRVRVRHVEQQFQQVREMIETIPAMAWMAHPDGSNAFVNRRWAEYTGLSAAETAGSGWTSVVHPEDRQAYSDQWHSSVAAGEPLEFEARFRGAGDGKYRWFLARGVPHRDPRGRLLGWYGILTDIEDRKRAETERERTRQLESELAHINRVSMMGELAASIAHEVNQPLSGIVSNASACTRWLARERPELDEVRDAVRDIARDGKRAGEVIARIRALTKRTEPEHEVLNVNETIRGVLAILRDEAAKNRVTVTTRFAEPLPEVSGDQVQLQQVVLNLVMNGMEAMAAVDGRSRELIISTRNVEPDQVQVTVEDLGVGLDRDKLAKIFEPFFTTKAGGMGMGLSISRSIVERHGGRLWATLNEGPGTSFHFLLPRHQGKGQASGAAAD